MATPGLDTNNVIVIRHEYNLNADVAYNVLHYRVVSITVNSSGLPAPTEIPASDMLPRLAEVAYLQWSAQWKETASDGVGMISTMAQKVYPGDRSSPYFHIPGAPVVGVVDGEPLPLQNSPTILKRTGFGQRWGIGRVFVVGLAETDQQSGIVDDDWVTNAAGLIVQVKDTIIADNGTYTMTVRPVVTNVPTTGVPRVNDVVSSELASKVIRAQRRRQPGKGI